MLSRFYRKNSVAVLLLVGLSFPWLFVVAQSIPSNNNIETWLPKNSPVRETYEQFKRHFGVEEIVLIGLERGTVDSKLVEGLCGRLDRLPGVRKCWSPDRLQNLMSDMGVSDEQSLERLQGLSLSEKGSLMGVVVALSEQGLKDRAATVQDLHRELDYCRLRDHRVCLAGAPVVVAELNRLGSQEQNQKFFFITLLVCLSLLYYWIRDWKLTFSILGLAIWAINLTQAIFCLAGGEMNFILGALSVMVMVFTLEASIHVLHYYDSCRSSADPAGDALKMSWKPCGMSMLTTTIGLFSVSVSDILPVTQFGYASALGAVVSMMSGLLITPAILSVLPPPAAQHNASNDSVLLARLGLWLLGHSRKIVVGTAVLLVISLFGVFQIESKIDPLDFLPKNGRVLSDVRRVESELTSLDSIEAVVDFGDQDLPFVERLDRVREIERQIRTCSAVRHTTSAAGFFPDPLPDDRLALMQMLKKAQSRRGQNEYISCGENLWRISARVKPAPGKTYADVYQELEIVTAGAPIQFTGIAPLLQQAQHEIFDGFWKSFTSALVVILAVMILSLWSFRTAILAIIPNLAPICMVFGVIGFLHFPVDIGMMMTGSIALGITVDGTFHLLVRYQEALKDGKRNSHAVRIALLSTGGPIFESIIVSSIGMFALTLSTFAPTARFGFLMATLLLTALAGGLVLLPALLALRPDRRLVRKASRKTVRPAHWRTRAVEIPADRVA